MKITFLGTRGNIQARSKEHYNHSSLLIEYHKARIIIDWGLDWQKHNLNALKPDALFITHGHEDHVDGLHAGTKVPVFATLDTWQIIRHYPIYDRRIIMPEEPIKIDSFTVEAYAVWHSVNAPAVGYKITAGNKTIFYVSDLAKIKHQKKALKDVNVYIGDGAIVERTLLLRKKNSELTGHAPIIEQLRWCKKEKVPRMIVTHCGTEITTSDSTEIHERLTKLSEQFSVNVDLAYDSMVVTI